MDVHGFLAVRWAAMISQTHRCIFVHVPKTAGQSIEQVFLTQLGLEWKQRAPLLLRRNRDPRKGPPRLAHLRASEYVDLGYCDLDTFSTFYRFSFVRNPWDRIVSFYKYIGSPAEYPFRDFVLHHLRNGLWSRMHWFVRPQTDFLYRDGKLLVDFVGRFESLAEDFTHVAGQLDLPTRELPFVNRSDARRSPAYPAIRRTLKALWPGSPAFGNFGGRPLTRYPDFAAYYDRDTCDVIARLYASDIEAFGYHSPLG